MTLHPIAGLDEVRDEWQTLSARHGNPFSSWEWASTWWRRFGAGRRLLLTGCRRPDGTLLALLPFYQASERPLRTLRFIGHGPGDRQDVICAPEDHPAALRAVGRALEERVWPCDVLVAEKVSAREWRAEVGGQVVRRESSPVLNRSGRTWEEFLESSSANLRQQIRSRERRLARSHEVRFRLADDPERLQADLDVLFGLHDARWGDEASPGFQEQNRDFHRELAPLALERGWLRLWFLELDGRPAAAWYGFRFGDAEWYYQAGRDPAAEREAVGFVLLVHSIREAFRDGVAEYRFGRGDQSYKQRLASEDPGVDTLVIGRGVAGAAGIAAARAFLSLPFPVRRSLTKLLR